jgi:hypothetical protein
MPAVNALPRLIDVGPGRGHAELAAADLGKRRDALVDFLMARARKAKPHPAAGVALVHRPLGPRVDRDARRERRLVELHRVDPVGKLDPEEDAALGIVELRRCPEVFGERFHQRLELGAQAAPSFINGRTG